LGKKLHGQAAPTVFDQKRPSKNEARNTKMDDLIRDKDHPLFYFNLHEFIFLEI